MNRVIRALLIIAVVIGFIYFIFFSGYVLTTKKRGAEVTIEFWGWGRYDRRQNLEEAARAFEREHPEIRVKFVPVVGDYTSKVMVGIGGGKAGDVMEQHYLGFPTLAYRGAFLDLTPFIEEDNYDVSDFFPIGLEAYQYKGRQYGLPLWGSTFCLIYNKDLFDENSYPYPDETWTFEDLKKAADFFTRDRDGDGKLDQFGLNPYEFTFYLWSNGGEYISADRTRCLLDQPVAIESLEYYRSVIPPGYWIGQLANEFELGNVAMTVQGPWVLLAREGKIWPFTVGVSLFPQGKAGRKTRYSGIGATVWKDTKHPEESWEFVKFLASREGITRAIYGEDIPARRTVAYSDFFIKPGTPYQEETFIKALETQARIPPRLPQLTEIWNVMEAAVRYQIVEQGGDVEKALVEATAKVNEILARGSEEEWAE